MEDDVERAGRDGDPVDVDEDMADADTGDDGGIGAAIALLVALLAFLLAVAFVILRHVLFHA